MISEAIMPWTSYFTEYLECTPRYAHRQLSYHVISRHLSPDASIQRRGPSHEAIIPSSYLDPSLFLLDSHILPHKYRTLPTHNPTDHLQ